MLKHNFRNHARFSPNCKHKLQLSKTISQNFGFLLQKQTIASKQFYVCSKPNSILKSETTQSNEITTEAVSKHYTKKWKAQLSDVYMSFFTALNMHFQLKKPNYWCICIVHRLKYIKWKNYMLQFFSVVYTQIIVLGTQWPQHGTHALTPWSNSAELQAQLLLYTQIAVLKHTFFKTLLTILCIWRNFHEENLLFSQGTHCHSKF